MTTSLNKVLLPVLESESDLSAYIKRVNSFPMLTLEEEREFARLYHEEGDLKAAHYLVTSHLRLVVKIALSYRNYGLSLMDVISEGNVGLMKAVKKFDLSKGFRLSTYAMWWIKAQIQEYILHSWSLVKMGTTLAQKKLFFNLKKIKNKLHNYEYKELSASNVAQISAELGVSKEEVIEMDSRLKNQDMSLNARPTSGDGDYDMEIQDFIADESPTQDILIAENQESERNHAKLYSALETLSEREKDIILKRRLCENPVTLEDLSQVYNISRERVRQVENKAIEKLAKYFRE